MSKMSQLDFFTNFAEFMGEMQENFPEIKDTLAVYAKEIADTTPQSDGVNAVLVPFRRFSRNILTHDPEMFSQELMCFGGIDLANVYNNTDNTSKWAIQQYLENLYISGNIFLKPHKKEQFLQLVSNIKTKYINRPTDTAGAKKKNALIPQVPAGMFNDDSIQNAMSKLQGVFGDSGIMGELLGDVTRTVGSALKDNDPTELMRDMLSGDTSKFGDLFGQLDEKYGERLQNEPIDENQLMQGASKVMEEVAGQGGGNPMDMMGMMQGLMGGGMGGDGGDEGDSQGSGGMMGMMQGLMSGMGGDGDGDGDSQGPGGMMGMVQGLMSGMGNDRGEGEAPDMMGMMQGMMQGMNNGGDAGGEGEAPDMMGMMQGMMQGMGNGGEGEAPDIMGMMQGLMQQSTPPTYPLQDVQDVQESPYFSQTMPQEGENTEDNKDIPSD
jgi:hypothetical protein